MAVQVRRAYGIVEGESPNELATRVTHFVGQGFVPIGGVSCTGTPGLVGSQGPRFFQAIWLEQQHEVSDEEAKRHGLGLVPSA